MTLYGAALLLAVFGLLMAALDALLLAATPLLLALCGRLMPKQRAQAILVARFAPSGLAALLTILVLLPAWCRHEPSNTGERASFGLLSLAALALLPILLGLVRAARMFLRTRNRLLLWRRQGRSTSTAQTPIEIVEVKGEDLALCVGGYLTPTIYASAPVLRSLAPREFSAAVAHEVSHARARDPLRLLWMSSCPDFLQMFRLDDAWRRGFASACEFAADAGASRGNPELALDLASALLKVARLPTLRPVAATVMIDLAVSSAFSSPGDLEARVRALVSAPCEETVEPFALRPWMFLAATVFVCVAGLVASPQVHALTEGVGRLLAP
jgi:Zn-dependent protease with chaperone function